MKLSFSFIFIFLCLFGGFVYQIQRLFPDMSILGFCLLMYGCMVAVYSVRLPFYDQPEEMWNKKGKLLSWGDILVWLGFPGLIWSLIYAILEISFFMGFGVWFITGVAMGTNLGIFGWNRDAGLHIRSLHIRLALPSIVIGIGMTLY